MGGCLAGCCGVVSLGVAGFVEVAAGRVALGRVALLRKVALVRVLVGSRIYLRRFRFAVVLVLKGNYRRFLVIREVILDWKTWRGKEKWMDTPCTYVAPKELCDLPISLRQPGHSGCLSNRLATPCLAPASSRRWPGWVCCSGSSCPWHLYRCGRSGCRASPARRWWCFRTWFRCG